MKRIGTALLVVALALLLAAPAAIAKRPPNPPETMTAQTCADRHDGEELAEPTWNYDGTVLTGFEVTLVDKGPEVCVDVPEGAAGVWVIQIGSELGDLGGAREVKVTLRDGIPGDWCWGFSTTEAGTFELPTPAVAAGACPIGGADGESIEDPDPPFAFNAWHIGKLKRPVTVAVTLPNSSP